MTVTIFDHPAGCLMNIEHDGGSMTLSRVEALELLEKLAAKIGEMPVNLN